MGWWGDKEWEEWMWRGSLEWGFPRCAQGGVEGWSRKGWGVWGEGLKLLEYWGLSGWGFLQAHVGERKCGHFWFLRGMPGLKPSFGEGLFQRAKAALLIRRANNGK